MSETESIVNSEETVVVSLDDYWGYMYVSVGTISEDGRCCSEDEEDAWDFGDLRTAKEVRDKLNKIFPYDESKKHPIAPYVVAKLRKEIELEIYDDEEIEKYAFP
jgi:hypothetical protein